MPKISEATRRDISDLFIAENISWCGRLEEADFLARLFSLRELPSADHRFRTAYEDIHKHRTMNFDWDADWVFYDDRFKLMGCDDELFLRFLCETVHPAVRPSPEDSAKLLGFYNEILIRDGYKLVEDRRVSGRPVYAGRYVGAIPGPDIGAVLEKPLVIDSTYVAKQIKRMEDAIESDPALAIGTAKELIETVCKTILDVRKETYTKGVKVPELVRQTAKVLKLTPDDVSEKARAADTIKRILSNLASIPQGIAELRSLYGTGHGKTAKTKGLSPRHARLAVGAATTLARFLIETHEEKG